MLDFVNSIIGLLTTMFGILIFIWITNKRIKGDKGGYGNHSEIYVGAVIIIIVGMTMLIKELVKL